MADETVKLLASLSHPAVQEGLRKSEYSAVFSYMDAAGLFERRDPGEFEARLQHVLSEHVTQLRRVVGAQSKQPLSAEHKAQLLGWLGEGYGGVSEEDLATVAEVIYADMASDPTAVAVAVVAIAVAVVVGVGLAVHVHVATSISIIGTVPYGPPAGLAAGAFNGAYARFDPALMRNTERAARLASLTGDSGLHLHAMRNLIAEEARAVMTAVQRAGIVTIREHNLPQVIDAVTKYSCKVIGLS